MWGAAAGAVACASAGALAYGVRGRSSTMFGPSVYRGDRRRRSVALTFDDGPSPATPHLLEILARLGVRATFFVCGMHVRRLPGVLRETVAAGHEIGNHTDTHASLYLRSGGFILNELVRAQQTIAEVTERTPRLFRAPYGARWFGLREAQRRLHLLHVMWTVIGSDWRLPGRQVAAGVTGAVSSGGIICLHDGRERAVAPDISNTIDAIQVIVPALLDQGYRFETVGELLCPTK